MKTPGGQIILPREFETKTVEHISLHIAVICNAQFDYMKNICNMRGYVLVCAEFGQPLTLLDVRMIVKCVLNLEGKVTKKFANNLPGKEWAKAFLKRHQELLL